MPATLLVPPFASALIASMRGVGYSLETALADLVDNSISAAAGRIDITWDWSHGDPLAMVTDNGAGMSEERLIEAMRFGTAGPDKHRPESDLGRFGLGLKTASLSQCRRLTVASKTSASIASFTWDIDRIREMGGDWHLICDAGDIPRIATEALSQLPSGTVVVWQKIDFGRKEDRPDHDAFMADLERADRHLGMVFHRFIAGDARRVVIALNGRTIEPWDPFLETHEATLRMPEQNLASPGGRVRVRGFVLPHRDRFRADAEFERAGGPAGWTTQQGFYVYRQKRLLAAGGWLGLGGSRTWTREEPSRLARIRIDIPNAADHEWRIDIRKAIARPPDAIRRPLQRLAEHVRSKARQVFVHRGHYGPRAKTSEVARIWQINDGSAKRRYAIRRDHDLVALLRDRLKPADRELLDGLLDLIERTVPVDRVWLDVTERGVPQAEEQTDEIVRAAVSMARVLERADVPFNDALARVARMDPFDRVKDLPTARRKIGREGECMSEAADAIAAMALIALRQRHPAGAIERTDIEKAVADCAGTLGQPLDPDRLARVIHDLEARLVVKIGRPTTLTDPHGHVPWYFGDRARDRLFFSRYRDFLAAEQGWPPAAIDSIDLSTDLVMEQLEDPNREGSWDRRGLVVGHVQSGKTANYAGLANKAADAGYKLIIVLAGMHNALRQQTQRRLDRDVLGYDTTPVKQGQGFRPIGVGVFNRNIHAEHLTTQAPNGDFNRAFADNLGIGVQQRPVLMVVKKNARILENLNNWVREVLAPRGDTEARSLLVIDDEADQASVDTGEQDFEDDETPDPDYEPKRINGQIRRLLDAFSRSAYVAYTATPFANILIHDAAEAEGFGKDLFPRSFIVNLPAPSNYVGPSLLFGSDLDGDDPIDAVRHVAQNEEGWISPTHRKDFVPRYRGEDAIPPSLEDAILSFVLACAARQARGQHRAHNSMLIHVSRFKDVHQRVFGQVDSWLSALKRTLKYRTGGAAVLARLKRIWEEDFERTSAAILGTQIGQGLPVTSWPDAENALADAAERIRVQVVNSEMRDAIDYDANDHGLSIIAIGGDKLSRGLTLEGLTASYFLRASRMYDSLMQMGRWFGYRPGYVDLCRLYLTPDLELWFRHVATAAQELRERLDHMAMIGSTPEQYGLRIQCHDILLVTAQNKMRHAREFQVSFQGETKIQTVFFRDADTNRRNAATVTSFLARLGQPAQPPGDPRTATGRRLWKEVPGTEVASLLGGLLFPEEARDVNAARLASYIRVQLDAGEPTSWTVAVLSGDGDPVTVDGWRFGTVERTPLPRGEKVGRYVVKTILSPRDETIDLDEDQFRRALDRTNSKRAEAGKDSATVPDGRETRRVRGEDPRRALLLLYPLSPSKAGLSCDVPIFGVVVSFPDSQNGRTVSYRFNTVEQRLELA